MLSTLPVNEPSESQRLSACLAKLRPKGCGILHDLAGHSLCSKPGGDCAHGSDLSITAALAYLQRVNVLSPTFSDKAKRIVSNTGIELTELDIGTQELHVDLKESRPLPKWISAEIPENDRSMPAVHAALKKLQGIAYRPKGVLIEGLISILALINERRFLEAKSFAARFELTMDLYLLEANA